jgi:hypothetical protein
MTEENAERIANALIGVVAVGAMYYILKDGGRRRTLWRVVLRAAAASGPWLFAEARHAWAESAPPSPSTPSRRAAHGI